MATVRKLILIAVKSEAGHEVEPGSEKEPVVVTADVCLAERTGTYIEFKHPGVGQV